MLPDNEPLLIINVQCGEAYSVCGNTQDIVMIPFTGTAESSLFKGRIIGTGVDTQFITKGEKAFLSARYMLEGEDLCGQKCRIFIHNQGYDMSCCRPTVVTDSKALAELETIKLRSVVTPVDGGVTVSIYKEI